MAYVGSRYLGTVSPASTRTAHEQIRYLPLPAALVSGVVQLRSTSKKVVHVEGLLLGRT